MDNWLLWIITLLAWSLRIALLEQTVGFPTPLQVSDGMDESDYELFAHQMATGRGYVLEDGTPTARRAPGTSLTILPIYLVLGRSLSAARLWITGLSALNCAALAWVVRQRCGSAAALLAAALLAVDPGMMYYSLHLWSEVPYCLSVTLATGCVLRAVESPSCRWTAAAGAAWAFAVLLRPQVIFLMPSVLCGLVCLSPGVRKRWLLELCCEGLIVVALVAPWIVRNAVVIGSPTLTTLVAGHTFWGAHNESTFHDARYRGLWHQYFEDPTMTYPLFGSERQQERQAWDNGWRCVRRNAMDLPRLEAWKIYRLIAPFEDTTNCLVYWSFAISWLITAPLAVFGLGQLRLRDPSLTAWIGFHVASVVLTTLLFYGAARFRHAVEPFLILAAAIGLQTIVWSAAGWEKEQLIRG